MGKGKKNRNIYQRDEESRENRERENEVQVRMKIDETLDFTEDNGGRRVQRDVTKETW
jgi:hypothetical protein